MPRSSSSATPLQHSGSSIVLAATEPREIWANVLTARLDEELSVELRMVSGLARLMALGSEVFDSPIPDGAPTRQLDLTARLLEDDVRFDIEFQSWSGNDSGGGFSYVRRLPVAPGEACE